jgi:ABC-2 type transport system ATP-binding protein
MNKEKHTTIFLTTHYMDEADFLCDRVAIIDHGEILVTDAIASLKTMVGNDVITIRVENQEKFIPYLKEINWIKNIEKYDSLLKLGVEKGEEKIPIIVQLAQSHHMNVKSISVRKPTLDDVFLHYTGRSIRDEQPTTEKTIPPRFRRR